MFSRYILFELKRMLKTPKNIVILVLLAIGLIIYYGYNVHLNDEMKNQRLEMYKAAVKEIAVDIGHYQRLDRTPINEALLKIATTESLHVYQLWIAFEGKGHEMWDKELAVTIERDKAILTGFYNWRDTYYSQNPPIDADYIEKSELDFPDSDLSTRYKVYTVNSLIKSIQKNSYVYNMDMQPILSEYDMTGWQFLYRMVRTLGTVAIPILVVLLCSDSFAAEKDMGSYKFLLLQPMSRTTVYFAKLVSSLILCLVVISVSMMLMFAVSSVLNGTGESGYPVKFEVSSPVNEVYQYNGDEAEFLQSIDPGKEMPNGFIAVSEYLIWTLFLFALYIMFLNSLLAIISVIADNSISALAASIGIVLASFIVGSYIPQNRFNPLEYSDVNALVTGDLNGFFWYPAVWALALIVAGILHFRKKDIVC